MTSVLADNVPEPTAPTPGPTPEATPDLIRAAPKVLLHDHLDGGLRPETVLELARDAAHTLPADDVESLARWFTESADSGSLVRYLETFDHTVAVMQRADNITRVARECVEDLAADGVVYAEVRYAPEQHLNDGLTLEEVVRAVQIGFDEGMAQNRAQNKAQTASTSDGSSSGIIVKQLLTAMRHQARSREIAELAVQHRDDGSVALGRLAAYVRDKRIPLEMCPASNVQTGAAPSIAEHPIGLLTELRFRVTVNTDNRLMSRTSMTDEMWSLVETFGYRLEDLRWFTINAMKSAFLPFDERLQIIDGVIKPGYAVLGTR